MLTLKNICKKYILGDNETEALKNVNVEFRKSEFVSILGPSGCGKTTLLNIIGGLDRYSSGDLIISGRSTKEYKDRDWDTYRNHTVGFVFQSYNLIPHQTVLSNVELALTLSGIPRAKRRAKAIEALNMVGLNDQLNKKPNQMSGGQMQRVAIARALVNDPEILLADEPTGALDSETSVQIMDLLKEISKDRLVVMVTHNPELAATYSTRIINLFDGKITDDSNPYVSDNQESNFDKKIKKPSMSFLTALSLSCNNLLTKKTRTILTAFAGSIGIIGIALILALSSGVDIYINRVEEDTLSSYPIMLEKTSANIGEIVTGLTESQTNNSEHLGDKIYSNDIMGEMMSAMINGASTNDLKAFKYYLESKEDDIKKYITDIKYRYSTTMNIYTADGYQVNPSKVFEKLQFKNQGETVSPMSMMTNTTVWHEMLNNRELLEKQYEVLKGRYPKEFNEVVLIVDENNEISDYSLYSLGLKDPDELSEIIDKALKGEKIPKPKPTSYTYEEILNLKFKLLLNTDLFKENENGTWTDMSKDSLYLAEKLKDAQEVVVVGILKVKSNTASATAGTVAYLDTLMTKLIDKNNNSKIVQQQLENSKIDVMTGLPFNTNEKYTIDDLNNFIETLPADQQQQFGLYIQQLKAQNMTDEQIINQFKSYLDSTKSDSTFEGNLAIMGVADINAPSGIDIYPKDFAAKEKITEFITDYNKSVNDSKEINYTDYIGLMMSSVTTIINAISYILIAFVSISLVVSSIMIGIITYISVLERTKEIGVLRAMGASKADVSRVFNAETLIVGFVAGALGILVSLLLLVPINAIIVSFTDIAGLAVLPTKGAIILVIISMFLTFISGLIPSRIAAKKEPVTALRTE